MHHRLQYNFPFCVGLILGIVFTVMFVIAAVSQQQRHEEDRVKRDIKPIRTDEPNSDQHPQPSVNPTRNRNEIDNRNGIIFVDNRDKDTMSHRLIIDRDSTDMTKDGLLQTVVITENAEKKDTAAEMTWAAGRKDVVFSPAGPGS